jgi:hypothetical protein
MSTAASPPASDAAAIGSRHASAIPLPWILAGNPFPKRRLAAGVEGQPPDLTFP